MSTNTKTREEICFGVKYATGEIRSHGTSPTYSENDAKREVEDIAHNASLPDLQTSWYKKAHPAVVVKKTVITTTTWSEWEEV